MPRQDSPRSERERNGNSGQFMKRFLSVFFIVLGTVFAAGAGLIALAPAAFDADLLSAMTGESDGAEGSMDGGWEQIAADDPYSAAAKEQKEEQGSAADHGSGAASGETEGGEPADNQEQNSSGNAAPYSYIPMDGTYSGDITEAGGNFQIPDSDGDSVTFTFAGDILFSSDYATGIQAGTNGIMSCFDTGTAELMRSADVFMVNNEFEYTTGGTPIPGKQYTLRAKPESVSWLKEMGVDIVSLANNHMFDYQETGLQDTLNTLRGANMPYVGAGENIEEASRTAYIHILAEGSPAEAMTIAVINATQVEQFANPDTRGATEAESGVFRCYDPALLCQRVSEAKQNADFVIVYIHWGVESNQEKEPRQDALADGITKAGADLIVGDHPHVLQAIGAVNGKPVAYSLGNFFFTSHTTDTGLLQAVFDPPSKTMTGLRFVPCLQSNAAVHLLEGSDKIRVLDEMRALSVKCGVTIDDDGWVTWQQDL